jgi:hypothetical protein
VEEVVGGIVLDPKNVRRTPPVTLLEQRERPLLVTELRVITGQGDWRNVAVLRLPEAPAQLPANEAAGAALVVSTLELT